MSETAGVISIQEKFKLYITLQKEIVEFRKKQTEQKKILQTLESDITDYLDDYNVYNNVSREDLSLKEVREDLERQRKKTDIEKVIELLEKSGYVVTKKP